MPFAAQSPELQVHWRRRQEGGGFADGILRLRGRVERAPEAVCAVCIRRGVLTSDTVRAAACLHPKLAAARGRAPA